MYVCVCTGHQTHSYLVSDLAGNVATTYQRCRLQQCLGRCQKKFFSDGKNIYCGILYYQKSKIASKFSSKPALSLWLKMACAARIV